jgi:hypothetical protein
MLTVEDLSNLPNFKFIKNEINFNTYQCRLVSNMLRSNLPIDIGLKTNFKFQIVDGLTLKFDSFGLIPKYGETALIFDIECTGKMVEGLHQYVVDWFLGSADKPMPKVGLLSAANTEFLLRDLELLHYDAVRQGKHILFQLVVKYSTIETYKEEN